MTIHFGDDPQLIARDPRTGAPLPGTKGSFWNSETGTSGQYLTMTDLNGGAPGSGDLIAGSFGEFSFTFPDGGPTEGWFQLFPGKRWFVRSRESYGPTGPTGPAPALTIGTVTAGMDAAATITPGAPGSYSLGLVLPKGDKGDQGIQGTPGGPVPAGGQAGKVLGYQDGYGSTWQDPSTDLGLQTHAGLDSSTASLVNTGGTATDTGLQAKYGRTSAYVGACIGDSISQRNGAWGYTNTSPYWGRESWLMLASAANGWNVTLGAGNIGQSQQGNNFAVSGTRTDQMLASQLPSVLALNPPPAFCTLLGGTNDIGQGYTSASVIANLDSMIASLVRAGIPVILGTVIPGTSYTTAQQTAVYEVNRWILKQPEVRRGVHVADFFTALVGPSGNAATPLTNALVSDGTHPSAYGAALMARTVAPILATLFPTRPNFPGPGDPKNLAPNPFMTGTAGSLGTGVTGTVATGWYVADGGGSPTLSAVGSKVARTDGIPGEWQQVAITSGAMRFLTGVDITTGFAVGDTVHACVEFQTDPSMDTSGCTKLEAYIVSTGSANTAGCFTNTGTTYDGTEVPLTTFPRSGVLRTPPMVVGSGTTGLEVWVRAWNLSAAGTLRIGRVALVKEN